ncbi:hypothetical protein OPT61_g6585 [Boeremia exigua]|uniref:Uncharacterized protein n=1 Tax=Boeremia exigua TaxID=749465 RepID=A0ACC2I6A2_9PLEO|nr:hypothetical protein OPT61_g6585 [Boeremia exigua]
MLVSDEYALADAEAADLEIEDEDEEAALAAAPAPAAATNGEAADKTASETPEHPVQRLDHLMQVLKTIPDTVDDLASTFYDLSAVEATETLQKVCDEAKSAVELVKKNWTGADDEFTAWSAKWVEALDAA